MTCAASSRSSESGDLPRRVAWSDGCEEGAPGPAEAAESRQAPRAPARGRSRPRSRRSSLPYPARRARDGRRPPRADELGQDARGARVPRRAGRGVFAAPLRMLAQEAHRRLAAQLGAEQVGLVTGEERSTSARRSSAAPPRWRRCAARCSSLDEVQWADDPERGSAWTRLLLAAEYRHILLLGAVEALPLVLQRLPGGRGALLRAQGAARLDGRGLLPAASSPARSSSRSAAEPCSRSPAS